ncbi:MAG: FAD-dependent oxidoreductase [Nitrospira sp.]|nr:FAD-dependent oxidoreductase [Nitrospira sp.]
MASGTPSTINSDVIDIAIIGGGCAGLYCAWRLANENHNRNIVVFEKEDRVGGRLLSVDLLPSGGNRAELGGMRFTNGQIIISALVNYLKVKLSTMDENPFSRRHFDFNTEIMYLRGQRYTKDKWPDIPRYDTLQGKSGVLTDVVGLIAENALKKAFREMKNEKQTSEEPWIDNIDRLLEDFRKSTLTATQWDTLQCNAKINGINLYNLGFWNVLQHCLQTPDDFIFLHDALGYESLIGNSNAAQAIPTFLADFADPKYFTISGGMESIPKILAYYARQLGCLIAEQQTLQSIKLVTEDSNKYFDLEVKYTPRGWNGKIDERIANTRRYRAKQLIMTLPKEALKEVRFIGFPSHEHKTFTDNLEHVTAHPALKLFLLYEKPWWQEHCGGNLRARGITDLPIRQVYYFGAQLDEPAFIMASYNDDHYVDFWSPLLRDPKIKEEISRLKALGKERTVIITNSASRRIIEKAEEQLEHMHGITLPASSKVGIVKEWKEAWHFWNVHTQPWEVSREMIQPFGTEVEMFTCGEAYSLEQGWVEGALKSAERVLKNMNLQQPEWLNSTSSLGTQYQSFDEYIAH